MSTESCRRKQEIACVLSMKSVRKQKVAASYTPQSNGMAERLVKTFKRDYIYNYDCYSAEVVMKMIQQ